MITNRNYEKCAHCWHFIEPNDAEPVPEITLAAYLHLDDGGKEHDHDAAPSGDARTIVQWGQSCPELFHVYPDGAIGPNSAEFGRLQAGYDAARQTHGDRYADYLITHDRELISKRRDPRPWPLSLQGNDGD